MMETNYKHIETGLEKVLNRLEAHENKVDSKFEAIQKLIYVGFGILIAIQFLVTSGVVKIG